MNRNIELLAELDRFLERYGLADTQFGILATGDGHLVRRIRDGRAVRRSTIVKVRRFMARHELDSA